MANKARGEVSLELDGETYVLVPSFGAVCEIEDKIGGRLFDVARRLELVRITARELADPAHACLTQAGYQVDKARLGESIVAVGVHKTIAALARFCRDCLLDARAHAQGAHWRAAAAGAMNGTSLSGTP
jgi:hypothetical protein